VLCSTCRLKEKNKQRQAAAFGDASEAGCFGADSA
jgi:hypothetical protein